MGVAGQIIPWNFPLLMAAWKIAPALACGNTVVLKPAETTPLTALKLAEVIPEAGLPEGVVNIVTGAGDTGAAIVSTIRASTRSRSPVRPMSARIIQKALAGSGKKYTLELGGKAANIIFDDAAIDQAVEGIVNGIFFNQGHVCCAGSRLLVQESVAERGHPEAQGPHGDADRRRSARQEHRHRRDQLEGAAGEDRIVSRHRRAGRRGDPPELLPVPARGYWCRPTIFTGVSQSNRVVQEEIFGPVLAIQTFRTFDEALSKANNTPYGLSGGVWTDKGAKIFRMTQGVRAGVIWANTFNKFDPTSPFGGYKESGVGREGGLHGLDAYLVLEA